MKTVFVVVREWGEYSDHGESTICVCHSETAALRAIEIMKELDQIQHDECGKFKAASEEYRKSLGEKPYPVKPKKSFVDPDNLISQRDWYLNHVLPYDMDYKEVSEHNHKINLKAIELERKYVSEYPLPEKYKLFAKFFHPAPYTYLNNKYSYTVNEVMVFE